jgi:hypothetical protein
MRQPKATLVFTTIFDPILLDTYYANFKSFGHLDDVEVMVIPDRKTPEKRIRDALKFLQRDYEPGVRRLRNRRTF